MSQKAADDYESIARRLKELEADQQLALTGTTAPATEKKIENYDYGYGGMCGYSLAHPAWPYAGTGFEWRKFVRS
mgnify:CR=1 FL=1